MKYIIIYQNDYGKFRIDVDIEYQPQVGNYITINEKLYRINNIEINPSPKSNIEQKETVVKFKIQLEKIILYCSESKTFDLKSRKHYLEKLDEIGEEVK